MRLYFPDLVEAIDLKREEKRLDNIDFASKRRRRARSSRHHGEKPLELTGVGEDAGRRRESLQRPQTCGRAKRSIFGCFRETDEKTDARKGVLWFGADRRARAGPGMGDRLFRKVLELEPDAATKSWSLLYLARLADSQGDREQAQEHYKAALAVEGAPDSVRQAAEKGLKEAFTKK